MQKQYKNLSNYELVGKLIEELKLRKYSYNTGKKYRDIVIKFLKSGKTPREFLLSYSNKSRSTICSVYFALKFFYENILNEKFNEKLPLAKSKQKLPVVLNKSEIQRLFEVTANVKHKVVLALLYYAGLRLSEVRNLRWENIDFEREIIHIRRVKGEKERVVFLHQELKRLLKEYGIRKSGFVLISERGKKYNERTIQQLLGHKSLRTTQIYTHVANRDVKNLAKLL